jgi:tRNA dimethylallyltransferase
MGSKSSTPPLIVIVGETASGKTAASIKVAQAIGGEIVCADSRTVYKQMDIGTAKPTKAEQSIIPHHLIDVVEPGQKFSAAEFKTQAQKCIQEICSRGKFPIVVGGSGLYVDGLLYNFQFTDAPNDALRKSLEQMNDEELTTILNTKSIDTTNLNKKNRRHIIRAIERTVEVPKDTKLRENTLVVGLTLQREVLKKRIAARVEKMFEDGLVEESALLAQKYGWESEAMSGNGYKVMRQYLEGDAHLNQVKEALIQRDVSLAKRQRKWFKRNKSIQWLADPQKLIAKAVEFASTFDYN